MSIPFRLGFFNIMLPTSFLKLFSTGKKLPFQSPKSQLLLKNNHLFFWPHQMASQFPKQGLNPSHLQWKHSLNHWTAKEVQIILLCFMPITELSNFQSLSYFIHYFSKENQHQHYNTLIDYFTACFMVTKPSQGHSSAQD